MPNALIGQTRNTTSLVQNIDQWKRYREVNGGGYVACTAEAVDYTCPWVQSGEYRDYTFNAPATLEGDLSVDDIVTYQWRPAGYDEDIGNADSFYITSAEYTIVESLSSASKNMVYYSFSGMAMA
jgi:hypothetical protein